MESIKAFQYVYRVNIAKSDRTTVSNRTAYNCIISIDTKTPITNVSKTKITLINI